MSGLLRLGMKALPSIARLGSKVFGSGGKVGKFLGMAAAGTVPQIIDEGKKLHSSVSDTFNKSKDAVSQLKQGNLQKAVSAGMSAYQSGRKSLSGAKALQGNI